MINDNIRMTEALRKRIADARQPAVLVDDGDGGLREKILLAEELLRVVAAEEAKRLARLPRRAGVRIIKFAPASRKHAS